MKVVFNFNLISKDPLGSDSNGQARKGTGLLERCFDANLFNLDFCISGDNTRSIVLS